MNQPDNTFLAQANVATALDDIESARMADFIAALDRVNAVAERSPGFVWRLQDESGNATNIQTSEDPRFIVNLSIWETAKDLEHFVWKTVHKQVYRRKSKWFRAPAKPHLVMWWVPSGHRPGVDEALDRLAELHDNGPSERAFGWESLPTVHLWKAQQCA